MIDYTTRYIVNFAAVHMPFHRYTGRKGANSNFIQITLSLFGVSQMPLPMDFLFSAAFNYVEQGDHCSQGSGKVNSRG
jgi:hypothetical protein